MHLEAGASVASFEIRDCIGSGGMGTVYRAHDRKLGRDVAIKFLQERLSDQDEYLQRFEREARSASALNHPNIVTVFEIDEFRGAPFIAMELVEGTGLREVMRGGPVPLRKLLNIATQIADGLAAAHERGIVHRDIKPENIRITPQGLVKILDFGLARPVVSDSPDDSTAEVITREHGRRLIGTAGYMSPEQPLGRAVDFRSDQFSFGAVLYEMATGRRAFRGETTAETIEAIIDSEPEPIQRVNPKIPAPLCWIVERCLSKDPSDRYASTTDLARELQTIRDRLHDTHPGAGRSVLPGWRKRSAIAAVALLGILAAAYFALSARLRVREPGLAERSYLAVLPFRHAGTRPEGEMFSRGVAEAVSARLTRLSSIQVIPPTSTAPLIARGADSRRIGQELGATLLLDGTIEQSGDTLKVTYAVIDSMGGETVALDTVSGPAGNTWALLDQLSSAVARGLGLGESPPPAAELAELETAEEQDLYLRALGHLQNHEDEKSLDSALALLRELLETAPDSPLVHAALGRTYLQKYSLTKDRTFSERAMQASDRARALAPTSPEVLLTLAKVQLATGRYQDAIATFKRSLTLQPNSPEAFIALATSYRRVGQIEDAERSFRQGIALRPGWWDGYNELGAMYLFAGRFDDAGEQFARVIELNPESVWGHSNLGVVHMNRQRLPQAIASFKKAASLREDASAYGNLGFCYYYLGDYEQSAAFYRKAVTVRPKAAIHWANLSDACRWTKSCAAEVESANAKAIELLNEELAVNPKHARAHGTLAVCLAKSGRHSLAGEHLQQALELEPNNPARMFQAARVANLTGRTAEAVSWLRRAVDAGYGDLEVKNDPEFRALRETDAFRTAFGQSVPAS